MPQRGRGRAVSHATYVSAYSQLETLSDARTLAADPTTNLSFDSLVCILSQKTVERTKSTMGRHRERAPTYLAAYFGGRSLVELAADHRIPPSMLVRVILEHLGLKKGKEVKCTLHRTTFFVSSRFVTWYVISLSLSCIRLGGPTHQEPRVDPGRRPPRRSHRRHRRRPLLRTER